MSLPPDALQHLLVITPGFPADEADTTCLPAVQQFLLCYREVFPQTRITVLALHYPYRHSHYRWHGINIHAFGNKGRGGLRKAVTFARMMQTARSIHKVATLDGVLSLWLSDTTLAAKMIARRYDVPYLVWMHGQDARPGNKYASMLKVPAAQLAAISEQQKDVFKSSYGYAPGFVVNNGINGNVFPNLNTDARPIDLLAVGSLIPLKQYHLFVDTVFELKNRGFADIKAILAGAGPEKEELRLLIGKYGLQNNITLTGELQHAEILRLMNDARVFAHTSSYEGHSTVLLEALYSGCKVASLIPVGNDKVENFSFCVDAAALADACANMLTDRSAPMRVKCYDMKDSVRQVSSILTSLSVSVPTA